MSFNRTKNFNFEKRKSEINRVRSLLEPEKVLVELYNWKAEQDDKITLFYAEGYQYIEEGLLRIQDQIDPVLDPENCRKFEQMLFDAYNNPYGDQNQKKSQEQVQWIYRQLDDEIQIFRSSKEIVIAIKVNLGGDVPIHYLGYFIEINGRVCVVRFGLRHEDKFKHFSQKVSAFHNGAKTNQVSFTNNTHVGYSCGSDYGFSLIKKPIPNSRKIEEHFVVQDNAKFLARDQLREMWFLKTHIEKFYYRANKNTLGFQYYNYFGKLLN